MRRSLPTFLALVIVCAASGVAIAGLPHEGDDFVITRTATADPTTSIGSTTTPDVASSTSIDSTATTSASETTTAVVVVSPTSTIASSPTSTSESIVPASTDQTTTTLSADETTIDRAEVRLVVANGDGRFRLASINGDRLRAAGYVTIDLTDFTGTVDATILYYRPGFDDEAAIVAADLQVPNAIVLSLPSSAVTINDELGDVIVVLGPDAAR